MLNTALTENENSNIQGSGLFAVRPIPAGDIIYQLDKSKRLVHLYELVNWPQEKRRRFLTYAIQMGKDEWGFGLGKIRLMNHSCNPNAWWEGFGTLTARRDISSGEEVTFDYSTSELTLKYSMSCGCGSHTCRGIVTNTDYLDPDFQEKYKGHFPQHAIEAIRRDQAGESEPQQQSGHTFPEHIIEAMKEANINAEVFKEKHGDQYMMEIIKQLIKK